MLPWHPSSSSSSATPPSPINIEEEGHHDLEAMLPRSTSSGEAAEPPPAPTEFGASTPPHQAASRRRGHGQAQRPHGPVLPCINLACHAGVGGGDFASGSELTGNNGESGGAAQQARQVHVDGGAQVAVDVAALRQAAALTDSVANRELVTVLSPYFRSVDGGPTRYIVTVGPADNAGEPKASAKHSAARYAKVLLSLFGVSLPACSAAFPVVKQAAPDGDGYVILAYGLLVAVALVLLVGLLATSFDRSPSSVVWGRYALQLALGLTIGVLTWSVCSLKREPKFDVPIGIAGALAYMVVVLLFHRRKW